MKPIKEDLLHNTDVEELEIVLDGLSFAQLDAETMSRIEKDVLGKLHLPKNCVLPTKRRWRWLAAACLVLVLTTCGCLFAVEARAYQEAVKFFVANDLSTEGLTRAEIKAVYRDITTETFTFGKTAEVILRSISTEQINGFEIFQEMPSPEELEKLWDYKVENGEILAELLPQKPVGTRFDYRILHGRPCDQLLCYSGDQMLWSLKFEEIDLHGFVTAGDDVIAYGETPNSMRDTDQYLWLLRVDSNGNILWENQYDDGFGAEHICSVLKNEDGTFTTFSRGISGKERALCVARYDVDGNRLLYQQNAVEEGNIGNAAHLGDGYLIQVGVFPDVKLLKVNREGRVYESLSYQVENCYYDIQDVIEFGGKIYISATSAPYAENRYGLKLKSAPIYDVVCDMEDSDLTEEFMTPLVQQNYSAVLLVCTADGQPEEFFVAKAAFGGSLSIDENGKLQWDVGNIVKANIREHWRTSSIVELVDGISYISEYMFAADGTLLGEKNTDRMCPFFL